MAAALADGAVTLVGHSGAGPLLPFVGRELERPPTGYIFVDAELPVAGSMFSTMPSELASYLRGLARDGEIPPWPAWWPEAEMRALVPDDLVRAQITAECPDLPLSFFEEARPAAPWWPDAPAGYVRLSAAYDGPSEEAEKRGWPVIRLDGNHLQMVIDPKAVAEAILALLG